MHTIRDKEKLLKRTRRLRGQVEAIERALEEEKGCYHVLHIVAACRGALNGLMREVLEGHVRDHVLPIGASPESAEAAEELMAVLRSFLR
ncbi:MAG: metal/formaldehyde-sensitive transcriptional repressor [Armatimonadetes bacterium]|nr:metal/formaldehyde-sensitive transcriptional repressor [Armatimonadota bacterium]